MFTIQQNNQNVYRPLKIESSSTVDGTIEINIFNTSGEAITTAGIYIGKAKNVGAALYPPDFDIHIDHSDIVRWGNHTLRTGTYGGLIVVKEDGTETYVSSKDGSNYKNRISLGALEAGKSVDVTLKLEVPPGVSSRRLYISINAE